MNKKLFPYAVLFALALIFAETKGDESRRPNVLFIVCDDLNNHMED